MWIRIDSGDLIQTDSLQAIVKQEIVVNQKDDGAKYKVVGVVARSEYYDIKRYSTEEECDKYLADLAEHFYRQDHPKEAQMEEYKRRWFGKG